MENIINPRKIRKAANKKAQDFLKVHKKTLNDTNNKLFREAKKKLKK